MYHMTDALSDELIRQRRARAWDYTRAAKACGTSISTISRMEAGGGDQLRVRTLEKLAQGYGVPVDRLAELASPKADQPEPTPEPVDPAAKLVLATDTGPAGLARIASNWRRIAPDDQQTLVQLAAELAEA